jgi:hypothetical protein
VPGEVVVLSLSVEAILGAMMALPTWYQDAAEPPEERRALLYLVAESIAEAAGDDRQIAAALIAVGYHESRFARYVVEGRCMDGPPGARCDNGRARGVFQLWQVACSSAYQHPAGSLASMRAEARCAANLWRGARGRCRDRHPAGDDAGAMSGYGRGSVCTWGPGAARAATMRAVGLRLARPD